MDHACEDMVIRNYIAMLENELRVLTVRLEHGKSSEMEQSILHQISEKQELIISLRASFKGPNTTLSPSKVGAVALLNLANSNNCNTTDKTASSSLHANPSSSAHADTFNLAHMTMLHLSRATTSCPSSKESTPAIKSASTPIATTPSYIPHFHPDDCLLCGRRISAGNSKRHQKTCMGRCLNCKQQGLICNDRDKGSPAHICKSCKKADVTCYYMDPRDGEWKLKAEIGGRKARIVARKGKKGRTVGDDGDAGVKGEDGICGD